MRRFVCTCEVAKARKKLWQQHIQTCARWDTYKGTMAIRVCTYAKAKKIAKCLCIHVGRCAIRTAGPGSSQAAGEAAGTRGLHGAGAKTSRQPARAGGICTYRREPQQEGVCVRQQKNGRQPARRRREHSRGDAGARRDRRGGRTGPRRAARGGGTPPRPRVTPGPLHSPFAGGLLLGHGGGGGAAAGSWQRQGGGGRQHAEGQRDGGGTGHHGLAPPSRLPARRLRHAGGGRPRHRAERAVPTAACAPPSGRWRRAGPRGRRNARRNSRRERAPVASERCQSPRAGRQVTGEAGEAAGAQHGCGGPRAGPAEVEAAAGRQHRVFGVGVRVCFTPKKQIRGSGRNVNITCP